MKRAVALKDSASERRRFGERTAYILKNPGGFALCVLRAFRKNQGLLLAGAVAYYTLLSLIPLLILMLIALSHVIDQSRLLATMTEYLEFIVPGQSEALVGEQKEYFTQPASLPAVGSGDLNTYKLFLNVFLVVLQSGGRMAVLVPSGIYTDEGCKALRSLLFDQTEIESIYSFENRWPEVFPAVDNRFKFATVCTKKGGVTGIFRCAFMQHDPWRLPLIEQSAAEISVDFVRKFSPEGLSLMEFPSAMAARIGTTLYSSSPLLSERIPETWNCQMNRELHMTDDSHLFRKEAAGYPLYEGKMIQAFDHRCCPPAYWIAKQDAREFERRRFWARAARSN